MTKSTSLLLWQKPLKNFKTQHSAFQSSPSSNHSPLPSWLRPIWYNISIKHLGIEATLCYTIRKFHIIEGRNVAKRVKMACIFCRYMEKYKIKVTIWKVPSCCTTITPAFFNTQADPAGSFTAYSPHNKRKTMKIWLTCTTTSTVSI